MKLAALLAYPKVLAGEFRRIRLRRQLLKHQLFDADWYLDENPDVLEAGHDAWRHFLVHGIHENRSPGPAFDAGWYAEAYKAEIPDGVSALAHYLSVGRASGFNGVPERPSTFDTPERRMLQRIKQLRKTPLFDPVWYRANHLDLAQSNVNPYTHFVQFGSAERRDPGPSFKSGWYQEEYLSRGADRHYEPLFHYLEIGRQAGFLPMPDNEYADWIRRYHAIDDEEAALICSGPAWRSDPTTFLIIYFADHRRDATAAFVSALVEQGAHVRLCIVGIEDTFDRVALKKAEIELDVVAASDLKTFLDQASPTTVVFARAGACLNPHALNILPYYSTNETFMAYADHEIIDLETGDRRPYLLPRFSPWLLAQIRFRIPLFVTDRATGRSLCHSLEDPAFEALFALALQRRDLAFVHIDQFLSAIAGSVDDHDVPAPLPVSASPRERPATVAIIIPTKDHGADLKTCIESIFDVTRYDLSFVDILVVDNNTTEPEALDYLADMSLRGQARVLTYSQPFNYSSINNFAASQTDAEVLVFLNNDTRIIHPDWLDFIASVALEPTIGAVGGKLLFPDDTIQHDGTIIGVQGIAAHAHTHLKADASGFQHFSQLTREVAAVTGACLGVASRKFREIGGFDCDLQIAFNDVALCIELLRRGYRNICLHNALLYHFESKTRGYNLTPEQHQTFVDEGLLFNRKCRFRDGEDPYYNSNLSLEHVFERAEPPRRFRPWRLLSRQAGRKRLMILSNTFQVGHGVATVIGLQAERLIARGFEVYFVGPKNPREIDVPGVVRIDISTAVLAARFIVRHRADVVVAHTPPFFSVTRLINMTPPVILYDYGEPPDELFPTADLRKQARLEKRWAFGLAFFKAAISDAVAAENPAHDVAVLPLANSHLVQWSEAGAGRRTTVRQARRWDDAFVILNVCRFEREERFYKGVMEYVDVTQRAKMRAAKRVVVVLCGKATEADVESIECQGVEVFANATDEVVGDLYFAADLYLNLSKWEGYNLGIAQALAAGLPVLASKIPAHDAFGVETFVHQADLLKRLNELIASADLVRHPVIIDWREKLDRFVDYVEACMSASMAACFEARALPQIEGGAATNDAGDGQHTSFRARQPASYAF